MKYLDPILIENDAVKYFSFFYMQLSRLKFLFGSVFMFNGDKIP